MALIGPVMTTTDHLLLEKFPSSFEHWYLFILFYLKKTFLAAVQLFSTYWASRHFYTQEHILPLFEIRLIGIFKFKKFQQKIPHVHLYVLYACKVVS
jgi:hypothetical protein